MRLCSLLPMAAPAMVRDDGAIWLGLQVQHNFGDPSRDLGAVLEKALTAEEPGIVGLTEPPGEGPRFQDLVVDDRARGHRPRRLRLLDRRDEDRDASTAAALEQANGAAHPTTRLTGVEAAYWTNVGPKEHLRWVMPEPEDELLDALARLHAAGKDEIAEGSRLVGMFRAHGLLVPVWDLPVGTGAEVLEEPAARFAAELAEALASTADLTPRGALRPVRSGQPSGHDSLTTREVVTTRVRELSPARAPLGFPRPVVVASPVNSGRAFSFPHCPAGSPAVFRGLRRRISARSA